MSRRIFTLSLGTHEGERRRQALDDLAAAAKSSGQRGPSYTSVIADAADAYLNEPELAGMLVSIVVMLKAAELAADEREHFLAQANDLHAQVYAAVMAVE